jgi:Phage integrase, N-terminal SAM-like domain
MTIIKPTTTTLDRPESGFELDEAHLAAASFLARYSGRTLEAYRHDLRGYFQWAADNAVEVLKATRPHIELFRTWMERRALAASTIDRRLSTVCGFYRFAHIDGRISSNPAQYVRRPQVHPTDARGLDRSELGVFLFTAAVRPPARGAGGPAPAQRPVGERGVRHQRRGPRLRAGTPDAADRRQGQQAGDDPARPSNGAHDRPCRRRAPPRTNSASS